MFRSQRSSLPSLLRLPSYRSASHLPQSSSSDPDTDLPHSIARLLNGQRTPWSPHLESTLTPLLSRLTQPSFLLTLDLIKPPSSVLPLFQFSLRLGLPLDHHASSKILHILLRSRHLRPARDFLLSLRSSPSLLHDKSFNALIRALSRAGHLRNALSLFRLMPSLGVPPSVFTYNSILSALLRRGRTQSAINLFHEMRPITPDVCTFNTLIKGFCHNAMIDEAFRFFHEMSRYGCHPDILTYNTLLDGLCRAGKVRTARNFLDGMRNKSPEISPNVVSYTILIRGYCSNLDAAEAVGLFNEMIDLGLKPNKITYNTLIKGLCEARRMDLVKEILEREVGFRPDTCTFNTLMAAHCSAGSVTDAMKVFDRMLELHIKTDSASYSTLIRGLCQSSEFGRAVELVDEILDKGVLERRGGCVPLIAPYNPIFEYLCWNGKAEKAGRLLRQLLERRATVDIAAFKTVILGHCREGEFREGYGLLLSMVRRDLMPDLEIFEALVEGFLAKGDMGFAWKALERMLGCGHRSSTTTFHSVLAGLLKKADLAEEAGKLIAVMAERKIRQNIDLSTDVVAGLFGKGLTDRAFEIVGMLYDRGYCVNMEKLAGSLCQGKKFLEARELLLFSLERNENLAAGVYGMTVSGLCATSRVSEAFELFYRMTENGHVYSTSCCLNDLKHGLETTGRLKEAEFVSKRMNRACMGKPVTRM